MPEIMAMTNADGSIALVDERSQRIDAARQMTPLEGAYLAAGLLATAAALSSTAPPKPGTIVGDAHIPIDQWRLGVSIGDGMPVLIVMVPPGIELTFRLTPGGARAMGADIVALGEKLSPPEPSGRAVH